MKNLTIILWLLIFIAPPAAALGLYEKELPLSKWPTVPTATSVSQTPAVREVLKRFSEQLRMKIVIRHPSGARAMAWAKELQQWFIFFGIPGRYVELQFGSGSDTNLVLGVLARKAEDLELPSEEIETPGDGVEKQDDGLESSPQVDE